MTQSNENITFTPFAALIDHLTTHTMPRTGQTVALKNNNLQNDDAGLEWDEDWLNEDDNNVPPKPSTTSAVPFRARRSGPIVAVDAGAVILGETETHFLVALRAAIIAVDHQGGTKAYLARTGILPLPLAAPERAKVLYEIGKAMGQPNFFVEVDNTDANNPKIRTIKQGTASRASHYVDRLRAFLERLMQQFAVQKIQNGTILIDGALTLRSRDTPDSFLRGLGTLASTGRNAIVGVSKKSDLLIAGKPIRFWLDDTPFVAAHRALTPTIRNDGNGGEQRAERVLGSVYAARFSAMGATFRVDILPARGTSDGEALGNFSPVP